MKTRRAACHLRMQKRPAQPARPRMRKRPGHSAIERVAELEHHPIRDAGDGPDDPRDLPMHRDEARKQIEHQDDRPVRSRHASVEPFHGATVVLLFEQGVETAPDDRRMDYESDAQRNDDQKNDHGKQAVRFGLLESVHGNHGNGRHDA